jgi:pSer/pThr/pTyr-binding forkhead associated (FHA) protein/thioredoxin reductase/ferredoxin
MIQLRFTGGPRTGQVVQLKTAIATLGRAPSCDIVVDDPMVSAIHVTLEQVPAGYIVSDQGSSNGCLVNGQRVFRALLRIGDELVLGSTGLKVETSDGFAATMVPQFRAAADAATMMPGHIDSMAVQTALQKTAPTGPPVLEILGAMGQGVTTTPIPPGGLVIGRHPDCSCVVNDPQVSSRHAKLVVGPEGPVLTDLGSSNGTFVNEVRLGPEAPTLIKDSDSVRIGGLTVRVRAPRPAPVAQPAPYVAPPPDPPRFFLELVAGAAPLRKEVKPHELVTVGRLPTSTIVLSDPMCSGQHAELALQAVGGQLTVVVTDVGSRNGTFVIGKAGEERLLPNSRRPMEPGESIRIGSVVLRLERVQKSLLKAPASVIGELPVEPNLPKQLRGARLVWIAGPRAGTAVGELQVERVTTRIGRASDNDVSLEDPSVSARHCSVVAQERGFVLQDHGSTNGCFVNGERVQANGERLLAAGDLVRVGQDSVFELRMEGAARMTLAPNSVFAEGGVVSMTPRFVIRGAVVKKPRATVGRDVACDVFIDDPAIARQAVEVEFREDAFYAKALAPGALVLNGKTVAESALATGDQVSIGKWQLRMEVSGARLTIHEQMSASLNGSWAREAESSAQAPVAVEGVVPKVGQPVFSTVFAADQSELEKIVPKREKKKAAPKWKATSDLLTDRNRSAAALIGLAGAAVILVLLFAGKGKATFLDGDLARGHDSQKFAQMAKSHALKDGCNACHTPLAKLSSERCQTCHTGFAPRQAAGAQRGHDHVSAKLQCASCHEEHRGAQRGQALVAKSSCSKSGCHDARNPPHQKLKPEPETAFVASVRMTAPQKVSMPAGDAKQAQEKLHAIHAGVTHRCMACHTASDGKSEGNATGSCFRCHAGPGVAAALVVGGPSGPKGGPPDDSSCLGCHAVHDQTLARSPDDSLGPRWTGGVNGTRSGGAAALGVCALFLLVGGFASVYFRSRVDHVARLALEEPGESKAKGAPEKAAAGEAVERTNDHAGVKLKVNVNKEKCVGCACCVNACPTAVLEIVSHKSTVTNEASCTSCRECEKVCPSGALTMAPEGAPPRLIDMPDLDSHYQTSVPGLYLIGEAAGKSLVKNACNLGKVTVDHMVATGVRPGDAARLGADVEVLSVGSGPGGLSAALTAKKHGLSFAVIEKDRVWASTIQYCPKGKEFLAEPFDVKNISLLPIVDTTKEQLIELWNEVLQREGVQIRLGEEVLDLKKEGELFVVTTSKGIIKALRVVLSPGTRGSPRKLGVPGQELEKVSYMLVDPAEHQGHHVMVVGGGDSAVECAMALAGQPGNLVTLSYRKNEFARIKPRNLERINQHAAEGKVKLIFNSVPHEVRHDKVVLKIGEQLQEVHNQFVYCLLGADLPMVWLQQLGVRYVKKPEGWNPGPTDAIVVKPMEVAA